MGDAADMELWREEERAFDRWMGWKQAREEYLDALERLSEDRTETEEQ